MLVGVVVAVLVGVVVRVVEGRVRIHAGRRSTS
uniref:Uncharacterized protein n=1 Tax=Arundo donax TaxID=35708 RepID=A0A0A9GV13_ARUDO